MTDTTWEAELAIGCAACGAPAGSPCLNDRREQVPYMHIDRVSDVATGPATAVPDTTQPDPQVVAWMRDFMRRCPSADRAMVNIGAQEARGERTGKGRLTADALAACYEAARKPLTVADIPAGQGAASLFLARGEDGHQVLLFKTDGGGPALIMWETMPDPAMDALWEHLAATLPAVTEEAAP